MGFTKEEKLEMFSMRLDGVSLQEIGDRFGVTREYIRQLLPGVESRSAYHGAIVNCIYPNIKAWAIRNQHSYSSISRLCGCSFQTIYRFLTGAHQPKKLSIDKTLDITGMTYEEAFATEDRNA